MNSLHKYTLLAALSALATACGGGQSAGTAESMPTTEVVEEVVEAASATVRFVHASTTSPIRVTAGDMEATEEPLSSRTWADRNTVPAGAHTLTFSPSGGGTAFAVTEVELADDGDYTIFFVGDNTSVIRAEMPMAIVATDALQAPEEGNARIRFVHAATGGPAVSFGDGSGRGYAAGLSYGAVSSWYEVPADSRTVDINAGSTHVASLETPITAGLLTTIVLMNEGDGLVALYIHDTAE